MPRDPPTPMQSSHVSRFIAPLSPPPVFPWAQPLLCLPACCPMSLWSPAATQPLLCPPRLPPLGPCCPPQQLGPSCALLLPPLLCPPPAAPPVPPSCALLLPPLGPCCPPQQLGPSCAPLLLPLLCPPPVPPSCALLLPPLLCPPSCALLLPPHGPCCHCRICYSDTSCPQEDQYPPNIAVKVNHSYCSVPVSMAALVCYEGGRDGGVWGPLEFLTVLTLLSERPVCLQGYYPSNKPGVEPKRPCRPINLTHLMYLSSATNRITVTWGNYGKSYSVALYLVRQLTSSELLQRLKTIGVKHPELCKALVKEKLRLDPDSEIATTGVRVSLICPLVKMRLSVPCRAETCAHLQCFDAVFYLQMNEKKPTWMCPVCDKPAPYDQLIIDGLLSKILSECEDADEIEYLVDGSWCPIRAEKERSCSPQGTILVLGPSDASGLLPTPSVNGSSALGSTGGGGPAGSVENGKPGTDETGRAWLLPESEISPVMIGKIVGVFPPEPLPACLLPRLIPSPLGRPPAQS
uniref:Protein inhibitor of activated STAT 4 n=1 Tax=Callithrix jacchus TaxID=9483 RepID=A0A8I3WCV9_CALJA